MIDDKTLARLEHDRRRKAEIVQYFRPGNESAEELEIEADAFRLARRYLALRDEAKTKEGRIRVQAIFWNMGSRKELDAAADRLLEENRE